MLGLVVGGWMWIGATGAWAKPRPEPGRDGAAEVAALEQAVGLDRWHEGTGAVAWRFPGGRRHLWDRQRGLARVQWGRKTAYLRLDTRDGRVFNGDREIVGPRCEVLLEKGYEAFVNDSFWLQPWASLRDEGVTTSVVDWGGEDGLLVEYASGGVTPGDAYLWFFDDTTGRPSEWRMWVRIIPVGGMRASWEGWEQLSTGAWVSTKHRLGPARIRIRDLAAGATLSELAPGPDPFAPVADR